MSPREHENLGLTCVGCCFFSFQVKPDEREQAERLFRSKAGAAMQADVVNETLKSSKDEVFTFTPGKLSALNSKLIMI